jgi:CRP-like cAMP-binding protein
MSSEVVTTLKQVFPDLPPEAIDGLSATGRVADYADKAVLCHEGQRESVFYIILSGKVAITKSDNGIPQTLATKERGQFFGEAALLSDETRSASVIADGAIRVIEIERETFRAAMMGNPSMALALTQLALKQLNTHQHRLNDMLVEVAHRASRRPRIFVSYSHNDREFATKLVNDLIAAGLNVWMDHLHIPPGVDWDDAIDEALNFCDKMLLILSEESVKSENVKMEWKYYLNTVKRPVVPVRYQAAAIPFRRLATIQYVDFVDEAYADALEELITTLAGKERLSRDGKADPKKAFYRHPG